MLKTIDISDIRPNPFNARKHYDPRSIRQLADEIADSGFWSGTLRGRKRDGKVELAFGHRRIEALKILGKTSVQIDILDLDDDEMAEQGLVENLQRQGLQPVERVDAIDALVKRLAQKLGSKEAAYERARIVLGYASAGVVENLASISRFEAAAKRLIGDSEDQLKLDDAKRAHQFGGLAMMKTCIEHNVRGQKLKELVPSVNAIPDDAIKAKVKDLVIAGKLTTAPQVENRATALTLQKSEREEKAPADLQEWAVRWTHEMRGLTERLTAAALYMDYIDELPPVARNFREAAHALIKVLSEMVKSG